MTDGFSKLAQANQNGEKTATGVYVSWMKIGLYRMAPQLVTDGQQPLVCWKIF